MVTKAEGTANVFEIIAQISKDAGALVPQMNDGLKFAFRGVNQVVDHLAPHMNKHGLVVVPTVIREEIEMHSVGTRFLTDAKVVVQYTFYAPDGSSVAATTSGYAQDYADRAASQAQSVAMRVAYLQVFHLPTSDIEPELNGESVQKTTAKEKSAPAAPQPAQKADPAQVIQKKIGTIIGDTTNAYTPVTVNELGDKVTGKKRAVWFNNVADLEKVLKALENGEVA